MLSAASTFYFVTPGPLYISETNQARKLKVGVLVGIYTATSVPNFNFLARLVLEIWRGSKIKSGRC